MNDYDMLFGVLNRTQSETGADISQKMSTGEISKKIGELIKEEYPSFMVYPIAMELVEDDHKVRIINRLKYDDLMDYEEELDEEVEDL